MRRYLAFPALACLPLLGGCLHSHRSAYLPSDDELRQLGAVADESKSCVFVFLIEGLDPLEHGTLQPLRQQIFDMGFPKVFLGNATHASYFAEKMAFVRAKCGHARFAVVGIGRGAEGARRAVDLAGQKGVPVDIAVYLEPSLAADPGAIVWPNRTVVAWADDCHGTKMVVEADDVQVIPDATKKTLPRHAAVQSLMLRELTLQAMTVPPAARPPAIKVQLVDALPSPRKGPEKRSQLPAEWNFLRGETSGEGERPETHFPTETLPEPRLTPNFSEPNSFRSP